MAQVDRGGGGVSGAGAAGGAAAGGAADAAIDAGVAACPHHTSVHCRAPPARQCRVRPLDDSNRSQACGSRKSASHSWQAPATGDECSRSQVRK